MRIFITGATGFLGRAVAEAATAGGHTVLALARSDRAEEVVRDHGWTPVRGSLTEPEALERYAHAADASIHVGLVEGPNAARVDAAAARTLAMAAEGTGKPFAYTSGVWILGSTGGAIADEASPPQPPELVSWRQAVERELLGLAAPRTRILVVRPGVVYGGGGGIPGMMARGEVPLVEPGTQRWPLVHRDDLASLYLAALERAPSGSVLHGVAHTRTAREVWLAQERGLLRTASFGVAQRELGAFAEALALDQQISAERTRALIGWLPRHPAPAPLEEGAGSASRPG